jgi:hypothetical protein
MECFGALAMPKGLSNFDGIYMRVEISLLTLCIECWYVERFQLIITKKIEDKCSSNKCK